MPITHKWNGTVLTITSDSGTSSCDLRGEKGDDGPRGPIGPAADYLAEDSKALGGILASQYALKAEVPNAANYALKSEIPSVEGFALKSEIPSLDGYAKQSEIPSLEGYAKTSELTTAFAALPRDAYNLLDNSDFTNPVNQRAKTTYTGSTYTIDRWRTTNSTAEVRVDDGYLTLVTHNLTQYLDINPDKTYTAAVKKLDGSIVMASGTFTNAFGTLGELGLKCEIINGLCAFIITPLVGSNGIVWAALYEGTYTAANLPVYIPKGYGAEYAECRRYYRYYKGYTLTGMANTTTVFACQFEFTGMRIFPSLAAYNISWLNCGGTRITEGLTGQLNTTMEGRLEIVSTTSLTKFETGAAFLTNIALSADY